MFSAPLECPKIFPRPSSPRASGLWHPSQTSRTLVLCPNRTYGAMQPSRRPPPQPTAWPAEAL